MCWPALLACLPLLGQTVSLRGQVTDESGALVPIIGNIAPPPLGQANQPTGAGSGFSESANNRRLELQTRLTF